MILCFLLADLTLTGVFILCLATDPKLAFSLYVQTSCFPPWYAPISSWPHVHPQVAKWAHGPGEERTTSSLPVSTIVQQLGACAKSKSCHKLCIDSSASFALKLISRGGRAEGLKFHLPSRARAHAPITYHVLALALTADLLGEIKHNSLLLLHHTGVGWLTSSH